jgi:hypothetical protein
MMKIGSLEIYSGEGKKLQETIVSVLEPHLDQNYHVKTIIITAWYLQNTFFREKYVFVEQLG